MAMTQRERFLAMGVGTVIGLFGLQYGINSIRDDLQLKQERVEAARLERDDINRIETSGVIADRKLDQLKIKSLPSKQETLISEYKSWLTKTALDAGLTDIKITTPERPSGKTHAYAAYKFTLTGGCRVDQWLDLLGAFYNTDYLHSIQNLKVSLPKDSNRVSISLDAQTLALSNASPSQARSEQPSGRLAKSLDEYKKTILDRNAFSPPNQAPSFAKTSFDVTRGTPWDQILETKDFENHEVSFEFVSAELPEGLKLKGKTLSWKPAENGKYEVVVKARDNGWPSMITEQKLTLNVIDPPPPEAPPVEPAKFDAATQSFVSAIVSGRSGPEAWIRSKTEGKTLKLSEGADFEIGSIKAKIVGINLIEDFVELESEGKHWTIGMDSSLADAFAKSQID